MLRPISKWVVKLQKSYIDLYFEFHTPEGAFDFYEVLRGVYVKDDKYDLFAKIYAEYELDEEKEEGENE